MSCIGDSAVATTSHLYCVGITYVEMDMITFYRLSVLLGVIVICLDIILMMYLQYDNNNPRNNSPTLTIESIQQVFTGDTIRTHNELRVDYPQRPKLYIPLSYRHTSQFWAVVTTIFRSSAAVRKVIKVCNIVGFGGAVFRFYFYSYF